MTSSSRSRRCPARWVASSLRPPLPGGTCRTQRAPAGFTLTMTNGYRNLPQQEWLFLDRYQLEPNGGKTKVWNGKTYYLKSPKLAQAASPGTSNHGWGGAVDMALDGYGNDGEAGRPATARSWHGCVQNAGPLGWSWEVQSEAWHVRLVSFTKRRRRARPGPRRPLRCRPRCRCSRRAARVDRSRRCRRCARSSSGATWAGPTARSGRGRRPACRRCRPRSVRSPTVSTGRSRPARSGRSSPPPRT